MSPIRIETIRVERFTKTEGEDRGTRISQVIASGDDRDPGVFKYVGEVPQSEDLGRLAVPGILIDVSVNQNCGKVKPREMGMWRRFADEITEELP